MQQYYKNTLAISIAKYRAGAMNAVGLLFDYVKVKFKPEWKISLVPKNVCAELGLSLSSFYRILKKAQELLGQTIYLRHEKVISSDKTQIPDPKNDIPKGKNEIPKGENQIPSCENQKPQTPSKDRAYSDTPDFNSDLNQISLSQEEKSKFIPSQEREKFWTFALSKVDRLPKRPTLPKKWIVANWSELYDEFKKQSAPEVQKATEDRQFAEWYDLMRQLGHVTGQRVENGVQLVKDVCGQWRKYEEEVQYYSTDYLKKCVRGR